MRAKGWFLTYPKCGLTPAEILELFRSKFNVVEYVIARENHLDMTPHIHAFLKVDHKLEWSPLRFDLEEYHGNY